MRISLIHHQLSGTLADSNGEENDITQQRVDSTIDGLCTQSQDTHGVPIVLSDLDIRKKSTHKH
jgi:hypothetical protein